MSVQPKNILVLAKRSSGLLKIPHTSIHCSATWWKKDEANLTLKISDNIMAAGKRYLKGDQEMLRENMKKRKTGLLFNFDDMVEFIKC